MRLYAVLPAVIALLQREGRVTYRALQRDFGFDVPLLDDVRHELVFKRLAMDEHGQGLVWTGGVYAPALHAVYSPTIPSVTESPVQTSSVVPALPPMELASETFPAAPSAMSDTATMPPRVAPTEVTNPEQTASVPTTTGPDAALSGKSNAAITEVESTLADAIEMESSSNGTALVAPATRHAPEAERRQLTVMFCDLVGSTDLSGKLDPEYLREVVQAYQETAAEVIEQYEGHIAQYLGDGLLIYFGFPLAHEDDAQRAVYTGLGIPAAMVTLNARLQAEYGVELAVRIGIHTGPVVVGEMGGGGRHENLALGETPNIAARLEGLAQANSAVISSVTAQLVQRSFVLDDLGPHDLKGVAEPMTLYTVLSPRKAEPDDQAEMLGGGFDALVGRDEEIGLLLRRWEQSKESQGQVVLISGEAGLGKSSLVEGLRAHVRQEGYTRIAFRCSLYTANSSLHPVIEHVQQVLGWQREDSAETRLAKLEEGLAGYHFPLPESVPLLANLLSLSLPEGRYPTLELTPQQQRDQTYDTLVAWMLEEAERQPLLAVWEDLHWADPSTLDLLGLFIDEIPTVAMMNVLAYRPAFSPPWQSQSHLTPLVLNRLERAHIEALVRRLAGGKPLPAEVESYIVTKTDGVPLYVEELTKMLLESDLLQEEAEQYALMGSLSDATIPATLQDSLMARLDRLTTVKELAQLGSVLGREFAYEMLQALTGVEEPTLQEGLTQLVDQELLYQRGRLPRAKYIFRHALIRDAAYQSLLRRTRQQHHIQVAQLIETQFPDIVEMQPELIAYHYTEGDNAEQAITYWQRAGQRAIQGSAYAEAIAHWKQGLMLLTTLPETPERLRQELDLQVALGPAFLATQGNGSPEVSHAYGRARELCEQIGDTPQLLPVLRGLVVYYQTRRQLQAACDVGEQLLRLADSQPDPVTQMVAHHVFGQTLYFRGESAVAQIHQKKVLELYNPPEHRTLAVRTGTDPGSLSHSWLSLELWNLGYPDQSLEHSQAGRKLSQDVSHPYSQCLILLHAATLYHFCRDIQAAHEQAEAAVTQASEQGFTLWLAWGTILHGWSLAMQGEFEAGVDKMQQGIKSYLATGAKNWHPYLLGLLAEAYGADGQPDKGIHQLDEVLTEIQTMDESSYFFTAELYRLKGHLLLQQSISDITQAESCFQQALTVASEQEAKSWELRAAMSLSRLWQQQGKWDEACELLRPIYDWFTEGFDTVDLQEAKALLAELST